MSSTAATSSSPSLLISSESKFASPPTIANRQSHENWLNHAQDAITTQHKDGDVGHDGDRTEELASLLGDASELPLKLQRYANEMSLKPTPAEMALQKETLPFSVMAGAPDEANLLCMFLEMMNASVVVEVGVFRGVTTLAFAQCLHQLNQKQKDTKRKVIGLDVSSDYAEVGQKYWQQAGVDHLIDFRVGAAPPTSFGTRVRRELRRSLLY